MNESSIDISAMLVSAPSSSGKPPSELTDVALLDSVSHLVDSQQQAQKDIQALINQIEEKKRTEDQLCAKVQEEERHILEVRLKAERERFEQVSEIDDEDGDDDDEEEEEDADDDGLAWKVQEEPHILPMRLKVERQRQ